MARLRRCGGASRRGRAVLPETVRLGMNSVRRSRFWPLGSRNRLQLAEQCADAPVPLLHLTDELGGEIGDPVRYRASIPREGPTGEKRTFHSLRHTYAKRALESGRQITWLSRHLGHSTLKVTTDIYGHWERAERRREAHQMEGVFGI